MDAVAILLEPYPPDVRVAALVQRCHFPSLAQALPLPLGMGGAKRRETGPVQLSMAFKGIYQRGEDVS